MSDRPEIVIVGDSGAGFMRSLTGSGNAVVMDEVHYKPHLIGPHGRAWKSDLSSLDKDVDAALVHWIVEAPWAHPIWHSYSIMLIHLRDLPKNNKHEIVFFIEGATHEIWLHALDPEKPRDLLMKAPYPGSYWLQPKNYASQIIEVNDDLALARVEAAVKSICNRELSPDTDYQWQWKKLFGNCMFKPEYK